MPVCAWSAQTAHWQFNPHDYEFDMTAYVAVIKDGQRLSDFENWEVAAFCGDDCRGVAEFLTVGEVVYGYLRIRSNTSRGENITFKAYDKLNVVEVALCHESVSFASETTVGKPSTPLLLWTTPQTITYNLHESGIGTLMLPFDADIPAGMEVYIATDVVNHHVEVDAQTSIKAGTPLIVMGEGGEYSFTGTPSVFSIEHSEGVLTGTSIQRTITDGYVLQTQNQLTGFYQVDADKPITMPAFRCWLNYEQASEVLPFLNIFTHIDAVKGLDKEENVYYDLQGRCIQHPTTGLYIIKGKKTIIK